MPESDLVAEPPPADGTIGILRAAVLVLARRLRHQQAGDVLSPGEAAVLGKIVRLGPVTPGQLARIEHVQPPSMTRIIDRLEAHGFITRAADPADGRQVLLSASPAGRTFVEESRALRTAWLAAQFDRLDEADREVITAAADALHRLADLQ